MPLPTVHNQKIRFALVGICNTLLDITVYYVLVTTVFGVVIANLISTSCGLILSYILNRSYTFKKQSNHKRSREIIAFIAVTIVGLWLLQPLIIAAVTPVVKHSALSLPTSFTTLVPKLCAIAVGLVWNYVWYSKVVFNDKPGTV